MGCTIWIDPLWCGVKGIPQSDFLLNLKWFWGNPKWLAGRERQTQGGAPQFRRSILPSICSPALFVPTQERYVIFCHGDKTTEVTQSHQNFSPSISFTQWWHRHSHHHPDEGVVEDWQAARHNLASRARASSAFYYYCFSAGINPLLAQTILLLLLLLFLLLLLLYFTYCLSAGINPLNG